MTGPATATTLVDAAEMLVAGPAASAAPVPAAAGAAAKVVLPPALGGFATAFNALPVSAAAAAEAERCVVG